MIKQEQIRELEKGPYGISKLGADLSKYTSFHIGGPCQILLEPTSEEELVSALRYIRKEKIPYYVMGRGSNVLVRDGGFDGLILLLADKYSDIIIDDNTVMAQSGASIRQIAHFSFRAGLTGMEGLAGIPGSVGGGTVMNAGAFGYEMDQVLGKVRVVDKEGKVKSYLPSELGFGYRKSLLMERGDIVSAVSFHLEPDDPDRIMERYKEIRDKRKARQPLEFPSAGSIFKRKDDLVPAKLIDEAGLKGKSVGDAQISEKHAGFIINRGHARAKDVLELISQVSDSIEEKYGIKLEKEIKVIGKDA